MAKPIILSDTQIKKLIASLPHGKSFGVEVFSDPTKSIILNKTITALSPAPAAEAHDRYVDIFLVRAGKTRITIGGKIIAPKQISPGEWRGEKISGGKKYQIKKDDLVIIPKGLPHHHGQGSIKMVVLKIK